MVILPPQEFLEFILDCGITEITWPFDGTVHDIDDLLDSSYAERLSIKWGANVSYSQLNILYALRTEIVKEVCQRAFEKIYSHEEFMQIFGKNYI